MTKRQSKQSNRKSVASQVRSIVESMAEQKRFAFLTNTNTVTTAGTVINLSNNIVQGDDLVNRTGDQIKTIHQTLLTRCTGITNSQSFRFIWFRDNTNRGTTPAVTEVLDSASITSQYNPTTFQQKRFTVFQDFMLDTSIVGRVIVHRTAVDKKRRAIFYNGAASVAASNGPGATFVLVIGSHATGQYDVTAEIVYLDM
ncbi:coat protein [Satellite tobacco necrosis virus 2]|uniref:Coat protein n=1 Tax=Satellite tobacco necrosis virus 2 TaxID=12444 RepID=COAT_STNV2|nr:coat protein [Satellite tobacco necrosis virus 2]P25879.1 RecName: Full=Coat protein [Satellite tobacco necrosis virus 2]AAA69584.1 coat protein [Satellite tobacco necrosis virus 2]